MSALMRCAKKAEHVYYFQLLYLIRSMDEKEINSVREIGIKGSPLQRIKIVDKLFLVGITYLKFPKKRRGGL
jgi:hypothetical protein